MSGEKICKSCSKQISEDFKICPYCGVKVEEEILEIACPSCGKIIENNFRICPYCKVNIEKLMSSEISYEKICKFCGKYINIDFQVCPYCRNNTKNENYTVENEINYNTNYYKISSKSGIVCLILCLFLGLFGGHRFYAGKIVSAIIMLILGVASISLSYGVPIIFWVLFDLISIIKGKFKDSDGGYIKIKK